MSDAAAGGGDFSQDRIITLQRAGLVGGFVPALHDEIGMIPVDLHLHGAATATVGGV